MNPQVSDTENSDIVPMFECVHLVLGLSNQFQMWRIEDVLTSIQQVFTTT